MKSRLSLIIFSLCFGLFACHDKVGLERLATAFPVLQSFWYESEATVYIFYHVELSQKIRDEAVLEYRVDELPWTDVKSAPNIQLHEAVDCGPRQRCGSLSLRSDLAPAVVKVRYRFHREGETADEIEHFTTPIRVQRGTHNRSFFVFGIFDVSNRFIQWRGRNAFPGLTHEEAYFYGLRRPFVLKGLQGHNSSSEVNRLNPPLYGQPPDCTGDNLSSSELRSDSGLDTWMPVPIDEVYAEACSIAHTVDAKGAFSSSVLARKNPVVTPIEQKLTLRFTDSLRLPFVFAACRGGDEKYLKFQKERLLMADKATDVCLESANFNANALRDLMAARILEARRNSQKNLALVIILHYTQADLNPAISLILADALAAVLNPELYPRVAATLIYDSFPSLVDPTGVDPSLIWCPTLAPDAQTLNSCFFQPAKITLGPLELSTAPMLPDYSSYQALDTEQKEGVRVESLEILSAEEPTDLDRLDLLESGGLYWAFHPNDTLQLGSADYLNYCDKYDSTRSLAFREILAGTIESPPAPLILLPTLQNDNTADRQVQVGLVMPYPFYVSLRYSSRAALGPKGLSGFIAIRGKNVINDDLGTAILEQRVFSLSRVLNRCTQYCRHPAFDESSTYLASRAWHEEFRTKCYEPSIPSYSGAEL